MFTNLHNCMQLLLQVVEGIIGLFVPAHFPLLFTAAHTIYCSLSQVVIVLESLTSLVMSIVNMLHGSIIDQLFIAP